MRIRKAKRADNRPRKYTDAELKVKRIEWLNKARKARLANAKKKAKK